MFVWKSTYRTKEKECEKLEATVVSLTEKWQEQNQTIRKMADTIRAIDQLVYQMGQCSDWNSMLPHFNKLQAASESRQRAESDRIGSIMRSELLSIYTKET